MKPKLLLSLPKGSGENYIAAFSHFGFRVNAGYLPEDLKCDGLVLCGGGDINPEYFGQKNCGSGPSDKERDICEFSLFEHYYKSKKAVFGICRGMQLINVALGGTLIQHIKKGGHLSKKGDLKHVVNNIDSTPASLLFGKRMKVNSAHHQACDKTGEGIFVMQKAADGITEGIYGNKIIATQWHPERMILKYSSKEFTDPRALFMFFEKMF